MSRLKKLEGMLTSSPPSAYAYAFRILKGRFVEAEEAISKDAYYSYLYARDIIKGRFILGEEIIETMKYSKFDRIYETYQEEVIEYNKLAKSF